MQHTPQSIEVFCHSGYAYGERPTGLLWEGERLDVIEVINRWRSPVGMHFLIEVEDSRVFELCYAGEADVWDVTLRT